MSALAGIFRFDPRDRVNKSELMDLAHGIDRFGPDGGGEYLNSSLGIAYRAFHTTPESHLENQPLVREGCVLTWDGRLDNREELRARISNKYEESPPTDLDLVFQAYKQWGTACFAELLGDWAIAIWDQGEQLLILARDYIGVRRLFYRLDGAGVAWCTSLEPLVLTAKEKLHLDLVYLAGCFYPRPPIETSPYREIRGIVPAHFLTFRYGGKQTSERYWSLNPHARVRYSSDVEYENHFRAIFRQSVRQRLRSDRTISAELSGGIDSSSVVCMADHIRKDETGPSIETLSYYDPDEPSGDERPYFSMIESARGRAGHHISMRDFARKAQDLTLSPLPGNCFAAVPGYFAKTLQWDFLIQNTFDSVGSRVVLSGLGGDEILGGVQYEAPELAEHLVAGRIVSFTRSLFAWSLARRKTVSNLFGEAFHLIKAQYNPTSMQTDTGDLLAWVHLQPAKRSGSLRSFTPWRKLGPAKVSLEWIRYNLAAQLTCTDPPLVGCVEKRYPYLDRGLFSFVASIPREQILQPTHRRHLMRRALREIVPEGVLFRTTKWFGSRSSLTRLRDQKPALCRMFDEPWLTDKLLVDAVLLRKELDTIEHGAHQTGLQILSAISIEHWLRAQIGRGTVELTHAGNVHCDGTPPKDRFLEALTR
jgi:asparagine synthase (glutamine-hydrolysing)